MEDMLNIFNDLKIYGDNNGWIEQPIRKFNNAEINIVKTAVVIDGTYGPQVQLTLIQGGYTFLGLDKHSKYAVGETVDLNKCFLGIRIKTGEKPARRVITEDCDISKYEKV